MRILVSMSIALFLSSFAAQAQKTNKQLVSQIRNDRIKLTVEGGTTKLMAVGENFSDGEAKAARVMAMNLAVGFFYTGETLEKAPGQMLLTFWIMSKKPVFAERHLLTINLGGEEIIVSDVRYSARARENMEYLNFNVTRDTLLKAASNANVRFKLGDASFTFTRDHMRMLAELLNISDPASH